MQHDLRKYGWIVVADDFLVIEQVLDGDAIQDGCVFRTPADAEEV